jgi:hypothetical protein
MVVVQTRFLEGGFGRVRRHCRPWVKSRHLHCTSSCPPYPRKRTFAVHTRMSALGQLRTMDPLLDHLVGAVEESLGNIQL